MIQDNLSNQEEFRVHYAFSVLNGMEMEQCIIDSGASTHICCNPTLMRSKIRLQTPHDIHLPDGSIKKVMYKGNVEINNEIFIHDVLLAPSFTYNLISVAQLTNDSEARCLFLWTHCMIQKAKSNHIKGI